MKKLIEIPMNKSMKKRVTLFKDGMRKKFLLLNYSKNYIPEELSEIPQKVDESGEISLAGTSL
jgi:hypothetical protein